MSSKIILGRISEPFGIHGWVHVFSFTDPTQNLFQHKHWSVCAYQKRDAKWQTITFDTYQAHGDGFIAKITGYADRDHALQLKNHTIAVDRADLPPLQKNQYYWNDLIGLTMIDIHGKTLGVIDHLFEAGEHDVMAVKNKGVHYVPYVNHVVIAVNLDKKEMIVNWELLT